jgi:alkyldihydroxyacetonephosphate synthase
MKKEAPPSCWFEGQIPTHSYRSLFKWGALDQYKHPNHRLVALMKEIFQMTSSDFQKPGNLGLDIVQSCQPIKLSKRQVEALMNIVGVENTASDIYARVKAGYGAGMIDVLRLREGTIENIPDIVLHPRDKTEIKNIVQFCHDENLPLYVHSGRSSVTRGFEPVKGGVSINMTTYMNKVIAFNELNQTITVEPGIYGPALEKILNHAQQEFNAQRAYTCGHFPQSFEHSTVGGWVVTRGAGQNSTYYGKIEDLVLLQEYITPSGIIKSQGYPRQATGPDFDQIMMGSEGVFGILVEVTLKVFRFMPHNRKYFSYMFKTWKDACGAAREIMQSENGYPSVFRISDPEETGVAMKLYGVEDTIADTLLANLGYQQDKKCLMLGWTDGDKTFCRNLQRKIKHICKQYNAFSLNAFGVTKRWEHNRFRDPYLRDDLADFGILTDTLECSVTWETLDKVHSAVRQVVKNRPRTICMTHISHAYPQGANLYFIFITRAKDITDYLRFQYSILDAIQDNGAAMSHHHGIGKQTAPWFAEQVGERHMALLKSLKAHFDPNNIMNPGGTLGLDMLPAQENKSWGFQTKKE